MDDAMIPIGEAARILGVTTTTLRRWTDQGQVAAYRTPGGQRRYLRSEIEALAARGEQLLTVRQAAELLGVSKSTLRNWTARGLVEATRTDGGHRRYRRADIERFVAGWRRD